jgi:hypothetical protein
LAPVDLPPVQLRDPNPLTSDVYAAQRALPAGKSAPLSPPSGGRLWVRPPWHVPADDARRDAHCPVVLSDRHETFSLLPDCLASRFPGELDALEHVVAQIDAAPSIETAADVLPGYRAAVRRDTPDRQFESCEPGD